MMKDKKINDHIGVVALALSTILILSFHGLVKVINRLPSSSKTPVFLNMQATVIESEPLQNADGYMIVICDKNEKMHFCLSDHPYSAGDIVQVSYINNCNTLKYKLN